MDFFSRALIQVTLKAKDFFIKAKKVKIANKRDFVIKA